MRAALTAALAEVPELDAEFVADRILPTVREIASQRAAQVLRAAAQEPDTDEGTHADGHRCAADFLARRAAALDPTS